MKQMGICKRVRWLAMHQPTTLPSIINDPRYNKKLFQHILHDLIPRRTSIEIECVDSLANSISQPGKIILKHKQCANTNLYPTLAHKYGILKLGIDLRGTIYSGTRITDYDEHTISIKNYTQLVGLHKILLDMRTHCSLNTASGCHIHVDISKILTKCSYKTLCAFFTNKCTDGTIERIFGKYLGGMMYNKSCDTDYKSCWITSRTDKQSLEFRTAPMTFDYSTIVGWFIAVNKLLNEFEYSIRVKDTQKDKEHPKESPNRDYIEISPDGRIRRAVYDLQ